jgi:hypothetical protein
MPEQVPGKFEVQTSDASATTITLDGDNGSISAGGASFFNFEIIHSQFNFVT